MNWNAKDIKKLRLSLGWSPFELGRRLGCRGPAVDEMEAGIALSDQECSEKLDELQFLLSQYSAQTVQRPIAEMTMKLQGLSQISGDDIDS